jgi:hypothetical protein
MCLFIFFRFFRFFSKNQKISHQSIIHHTGELQYGAYHYISTAALILKEAGSFA